MLVAAIVAVAVLVVDRRGARLLAPPPDAPEGPDVALPELPPSTMGLSVEMGLGAVRRALEERVPSRLGDVDERRAHPEYPGVSYGVELEREPLRLELRGDTLRVMTVVHYDGRVRIPSPVARGTTVSCRGGSGERPRALVRLSTPLVIRPDWRIGVDVTIDEVRPASDGERDRCRVGLGPFRLDLTDALLALAEARLRETAGELEEVIGRFDLRAAFAEHWSRVQTPVRLAAESWLRLAPDSIRIGELGSRPGRPDTVTAALTLVGRPRITVGSPPPPSRTPLPPLRRGPGRERFAALVEARIDYEVASRVASEALGGREIALRGRSVRVEGVQVEGIGGGRLAARIDVAGAVRGRLYIVGTPRLDPSTEEVTVPDLRFSVRTENPLVRAAAWLARGVFPERIRRAARWDATTALERARGLAARDLDRDLGGSLRLEGSLDDAELVSVTAQRDALIIRSEVGGTLRVRIVPAAS